MDTGRRRDLTPSVRDLTPGVARRLPTLSSLDAVTISLERQQALRDTS